jgi:hypothetical protein
VRYASACATLRSFDCESAVPQERDEAKSGRLFAQDDTLSFINFEHIHDEQKRSLCLNEKDKF